MRRCATWHRISRTLAISLAFSPTSPQPRGKMATYQENLPSLCLSWFLSVPLSAFWFCRWFRPSRHIPGQHRCPIPHLGTSPPLGIAGPWRASGRRRAARDNMIWRNMLPTDVRDAADSFRYMQSAHQSRPTLNPTKRGSGRPASAQCIASNSASLLSSNLFRCSMPSLSRRGGGLAVRSPPQSVVRLTH